MSSRLVSRAENYPEWYQQLVREADLAENSDVKGCMVIKPYGFAIWEHMRDTLDRMFKETGHVNAYFPLFIPKSYLSREAAHVEGFAKECAVVTHYRLMNDPDGSGVIVDPKAKLEEELIVRPTSETIIWSTYRNWIQSYRDLPLLINQWANVVRWEMRTRLFLRTTEFLWQEGHTAHASAEEAVEETRRMLDVYTRFAEDYMAMPVLRGVKTESERFAGAVDTYCIEALMQDGKALQAGTSHFLGQNFAKAFNVKFLSKENKEEYVWATSWGVSTRLMGALIMTHGDDAGLIVPPRLAPIQVVMVPVYKKEEELDRLREIAKDVAAKCRNAGISFKFDDDDSKKPGWKFANYEMRGVPVRLTLGMRDVESGQIEVYRRDTQAKESRPLETIVEQLPTLLEDIQRSLFQIALNRRETSTQRVDNYEDFKRAIAAQQGFVMAHWDGSPETEKQIKDDTKATIRCIPLDAPEEPGQCVLTGRPSSRRVVFAQSY